MKAPNELYLQLRDQHGNENPKDLVTWSATRIEESDVKYIRVNPKQQRDESLFVLPVSLVAIEFESPEQSAAFFIYCSKNKIDAFRQLLWDGKKVEWLCSPGHAELIKEYFN